MRIAVITPALMTALLLLPDDAFAATVSAPPERDLTAEIRTPATSLKPRINGPRVYGALVYNFRIRPQTADHRLYTFFGENGDENGLRGDRISIEKV